MNKNLSILIEYINDNFKFGTVITNNRIEELLAKYPISKTDREQLYKELEFLEIKLVGIKQDFKNENKTENARVKTEEKEGIGNKYYEDKDKIEEYDEFDFLDEYEFEDLDVVLEDEKFHKELSKLRDVADKSHNIEYLKEYQGKKTDNTRRKIALDNLARANEKLVWKIVSKYEKFKSNAFDEFDMFQAGMEGLMKAADRFAIDMGYQFSTYATFWIKQSIYRNILNCSSTIRIPVHMLEYVHKYIRIKKGFLKENEREASDIEVSELMGVSIDKIEDLKRCKEIMKLTSLDMAIGEEEKTFLIDIIPDNNSKSPEESVEQILLRKAIKELMESKLTGRERRVLESRMGVVEDRVYTLEEIGKRENVTRERIRQIESKALKKLRSFKTKQRIGDFYED